MKSSGFLYLLFDFFSTIFFKYFSMKVYKSLFLMAETLCTCTAIKNQQSLLILTASRYYLRTVLFSVTLIFISFSDPY